LCLDEIGDVDPKIEAALRAALGTGDDEFGMAARLAKRYPISDEQLKSLLNGWVLWSPRCAS
jgi:hypothetical protein